MNIYKTTRVIGADRKTHHNNKWAVRKFTNGGLAHDVFVAAGDKAEERSEYVRDMFARELTVNEQRFFQKLLSGDNVADNELRAIVGAKPRSNG